MKKWGFITGLLITSSVFYVQAAEVPQEFRVTEVEGHAGILPEGGRQVSPLKPGVPLSAGDRIVTGTTGRVQMASKEGTVMELKENSYFKLSKMTRSESSFFLKTGRIFAKFASLTETGYATRIRTPVAVAAVRGTELALAVDEENKEVQAGVIEGSVGFQSTEWSDNEAEDLEEEDDPERDHVLLETDEGLVVKPDIKPEKLTVLPPLVKDSVAWFPPVRERIPALRSQWKELDRPARLKLRERAFKERVKWDLPKPIRRQIEAPRHQLKDFKSAPKRNQPGKVKPRRNLR